MRDCVNLWVLIETLITPAASTSLSPNWPTGVPGAAVPPLAAVFRRYAVNPEDQPVVPIFDVDASALPGG
jgi:hypothetical protein